jgi:two-component system sensor histidine kinase KdpD
LDVPRKTPEQLLREVQAEEAAAARAGHLKIMLGYSSGAGKTFRLLDEARRRRARGQDVVVGAMQPNVPEDIRAILPALDVVPLKRTEAGAAIDAETIIRRHPMVCFIDGLAYNNPPDARRKTRWEDVQDLVAAGIKVVASINVQFIAELQDQIEEITGRRRTETAPLSFIASADEIEIVDAPPEEGEERREQLSRLRELALVLAADVVDRQLTAYLDANGIHQRFGAHERILVCITPRGNVQEMLDAACLVADRFHGQLLAAYVKQPSLSKGDQAALDSKIALARAAGATVDILDGDDPAEALLDFARERCITQLYVGHSQQTGLFRWKRGPLDRLIWEGHGMDVRVFPQTA